MSTNNGHTPTQIDYDLHGIVGIRLLDAMPADAAVVTRQIGPIQTALSREPDITIRFVDRLPLSSQVRYLGVNDVGFTDDAFLILHSKHKTRARVQIPFDQIGKQCEIVCERGLAAVPLLIQILNMTMLAKGFLPMHASAFTYKSTGVVATGWAKGGKTETLFAFMANGAAYVGDEWVYFSLDGQQMYGIPEPIRVWHWHLAYLPQYQAQVDRNDQAKLRTLNLLVNSMSRVAGNGAGRKSAPARLAKRVVSVLQRQQYVHLPPHKTFGQEFCPLVGRPDKFFFVASHEASDVTIQPMNPDEIAQRMVFSLQEEQMELTAYYLKFRFAFPEASNELIERSESLQLQALARVLKGKEAYAVYHPYPVPIPLLFDTIGPYCV